MAERLQHLTMCFAAYQQSNKLNKRLIGVQYRVNTAPSKKVSQPKMRIRL